MSKFYWLIIILGIIIAINLYSTTHSNSITFEGLSDNTYSYAADQCERAQDIIDDARKELNTYKNKVSDLINRVNANKKAVAGLQKQVKICMEKTRSKSTKKIKYN